MNPCTLFGFLALTWAFLSTSHAADKTAMLMSEPEYKAYHGMQNPTPKLPDELSATVPQIKFPRKASLEDITKIFQAEADKMQLGITFKHLNIPGIQPKYVSSSIFKNCTFAELLPRVASNMNLKYRARGKEILLYPSFYLVRSVGINTPEYPSPASTNDAKKGEKPYKKIRSILKHVHTTLANLKTQDEDTFIQEITHLTDLLSKEKLSAKGHGNLKAYLRENPKDNEKLNIRITLIHAEYLRAQSDSKITITPKINKITNKFYYQLGYIEFYCK